MKQTAVIWRESIYKNDFKCNQCGSVCATKNGKVADHVLMGGKWLFCGNCKNCIAKVEEVDANIKPGLHGNIDEYRKSKMN